MARPISSRRPSPLNIPTGDLGIATTPVPMLQPPKGLDLFSPLNRIKPGFVSGIQNLWLDRGVLRSRYGTAQAGAPAANPVMAVINFVMGSGVGFVLRTTTRRLEVFSGGVWTTIGTGDVFTGGENDYFSFTAFNDSLLMTNGIDGIWEYSPTSGSFQRIASAPSGLHLTTFAGRVLVSGADEIDTRIRWSVKNNSHDWTGIGSGFEDLLSTPGGQIDQQTGVWPLSEGIALAVRSNSIWQLSETGNVDQPFRFSRIYDNLGTRSPRAVDSVPGGIVMYGTDDIYVIDERNIKAIGTLVKDSIQATVTDLYKVHGVYSPKTKEFLLAYGEFVVFRYSFQDDGWTKSVYPFTVRSLEETVFHYSGLTIDELQGNIDSLQGTIDDLRGPGRTGLVHFATTDPQGVVHTQSPDLVEDEAGEIGIELITGVILANDPLKFTTINEVQLEYESGQLQNLTLEWSTDRGNNWNPFDVKTIDTSDNGPDLASFLRTLTAKNIMLKLSSPSLGRLTIVGLWPHIFQAGKVHP